MSVTSVRDRLREGAERVGAGRFRIDSARALAKMRDFRLANSYDYCLEMLRAAVVSGATRVDVRSDADEVEIVFDGLPFPAEGLNELFGCALAGGEDKDSLRLKLLALGVIGALALKPLFVEIRGSGLTVRVEPPDRLEVVPGPESPDRPTRVYMKKRFGWRVVKSALSGAPELSAIRSHTHHFPVALRINEQPFETPAYPNLTFLAKRERHEGPLHFYVGVPDAPSWPAGQASVLVAVHGVTVVKRLLNLSVLPLAVWARDDRLKTNASGSDVVDDAAFKSLCDAVVAMGGELMGDLVKMLESEYSDRVRALLVGSAVFADLGKGSHKLGPCGALLDARLLPGPAGEWLSLAEIRAATDRKRPLKVAYERYPKDVFDPPVVLLPLTSDEEKLLPDGPMLDIRTEVETRRKRDRNRALWEAQPEEEARLGGGEYLARARLEAENATGEVGLPTSAEVSVARFLRSHKLLEETELPELLPLRLRAVVDSERLTPDDTWQKVKNDPVRRKLLSAIADAAIAAVVEALGGKDEPGNEVRRHARDVAVWLLKKKRKLPDSLRAARLYSLAGGGWISIDAMAARPSLRYVEHDWPHPALDGEPVVVLPHHEVATWKRVRGGKGLQDFSERRRREMELRKRRAGPPEEPRLSDPALARVPIEGEDLEGEIVLPENGASGVTLRVLKAGFRLEETKLDSTYGRVIAVVDSQTLEPTPGWDGAVRNAAYERVVAAVRASEPRLLPPLIEKMRNVSLHVMPMPAREYILGFMKHHLVPGKDRTLPQEDPLRKALLEWRLFAGARGLLSLSQILEASSGSGKLWIVPPAKMPDTPRDMTIVGAGPDTAEVLGLITGLEPEAPFEELERIAARKEFARRAERSTTLPAGVTVRVSIDEQRFRGEMGYVTGEKPEIRVDILYKKRLLSAKTVESPFPLVAVVETDDPSIDPADVGLSAAIQKRLISVLASAQHRLVEAALASAADRDSVRELLLRCVETRYESHVPGLATQPLFPTTSGGFVTLADLKERRRICYALEPLEGALASGEPVVLALDPAVRAALARFGRRRYNATPTLGDQIAARRARERLKPLSSIRVSGSTLWRRKFEGDGMEGEVAVVPGTGKELEAFHERRPICREPLEVPEGVAAAVNCDKLAPRVRLDGIMRDQAYKEVLERVLLEVDSLAADVAAGWPDLSASDRARLQPMMVRLAGWLLDRERKDHAALALPILVSTDGRPLSPAELLRARESAGKVLYSEREGSLLTKDAWVWRPRPGELEAMGQKRLRLVDATDAILRAQEVRSAPPVETLEAPIESRWREPVASQGIEGEVALHAERIGELSIELFFERRRLETVVVPHPVGGVARVNNDALQPDASWSRAERDAAFQATRAGIDLAIERALARLLMEGSREDWTPFVRAASRWKFGRGGPIAEALLWLPLFRDLESQEVTVGRAIAEASERGNVAFVEDGQSHPAPPNRLVLSATEKDRSHMNDLGLKTLDLTEQAKEAADRAARLEERRIGKLRYAGEALVRLAVSEEGWRGELALPDPPDATASIVLSRDGIAVDRFHVADLGVAGVLEHADLPVEANWSRALLDDGARKRISDWVSSLYTVLAEKATALPPKTCEIASQHAFRRLSHLGVRAPQHLDRLPPAADKLTRGHLLVTADGRRADLRTVADLVLSRGVVSVIGGPIDRDTARESEGEMVLRASAVDAPWVAALESLLGKGSLALFPDASSWRTHRRERDPEPSDPLGVGLALLRREARLLRADATGRLSESELRDVLLHRADGDHPIRYDAARGVALLDPSHSGIMQTLVEATARPDRIYVLVAAIYGAINRALDRVTDEDEVRLAGALLEHVAANADPAS